MKFKMQITQTNPEFQQCSTFVESVYLNNISKIISSGIKSEYTGDRDVDRECIREAQQAVIRPITH